jgi:hypothetical protein
MKKNFSVGVIIAAMVTIGIVLIAAGWRYQPLTSETYRETVLTSADTEVVCPGNHNAVQTCISNDGTGRLYINWKGASVNTSTDFFLEAGESLQNINIPWRKLHLKAAHQVLIVEL